MMSGSSVNELQRNNALVFRRQAVCACVHYQHPDIWLPEPKAAFMEDVVKYS